MLTGFLYIAFKISYHISIFDNRYNKYLNTFGLNTRSTPLRGKSFGATGKFDAACTAGTDGNTGTAIAFGGAVGMSSSISKSWACNGSPWCVLAATGSTPTISPGIPRNYFNILVLSKIWPYICFSCMLCLHALCSILLFALFVTILSILMIFWILIFQHQIKVLGQYHLIVVALQQQLWVRFPFEKMNYSFSSPYWNDIKRDVEFCYSTRNTSKGRKRVSKCLNISIFLSKICIHQL